MNGDSYVRSQEEDYKRNPDLWANMTPDALRYNLYKQYHKVIASLILPRYKTVVDIGCGVGGLVNLINTTTDFKAIGVDSSETAISEARKHFPNWHFEVGDVRYWKPDRVFYPQVDMVLLTGPYHHLASEERIATLEHIKSYLNPGGALLLAYGGEIYLDGRVKSAYPDLSHEIFSVFERQQYIRYMYNDLDRDQQGSWVFYVGEKK